MLHFGKKEVTGWKSICQYACLKVYDLASPWIIVHQRENAYVTVSVAEFVAVLNKLAMETERREIHQYF